jgi:DNA modification methylase
MIHNGDCVEVMAAMPENSVDAIVCDPPYGLEFMGKEWDSFAPQVTTSRVQRTDGGRLDATVSGPTPQQRHKVSYPSDSRLMRCSKCQGWSGSFSAARAKRQKQCICDSPLFTPSGPPSQMVAFQEWSRAWATEAFRVAKPGAYLLAFGGTRTYHRLAVAIEDAGWIIRDCLVWAYASGFPKSKSLLKPSWEPIVAARKPFSVPLQLAGEVHHAIATLLCLAAEPTSAPHGEHRCVAEHAACLFADSDTTATSRSRAVDSTSSSIALSWGGILAALSLDGSRFTTSTATRLTTALRTLSSCLSPITSSTATPPCASRLSGSSSPADTAASSSSAECMSTLDTLRRTVPASAISVLAQTVAAVSASIAAELSDDLAVDVTALGSATTEVAERADSRPIVMARKPGPLRELAIDACRIPSEPWTKQDGPTGAGFKTGKFMGSMGIGEPTLTEGTRESTLGRWPANVLLTPTEDGRAIFDGGVAGVVGGGEVSPPKPERVGLRGGTAWHGMESFGSPDKEGRWPADPGGSYSRFFLIPKSARSEREPVFGGLEAQHDDPDGSFGLDAARPHTKPDYQYKRKPRTNVHPTVKPLDLMRHLVRLVTPQGGTVLDPFLGSGTTAIAAEMEGFAWIGIEREPEYVAIAEARLMGVQRGLGLDVA